MKTVFWSAFALWFVAGPMFGSGYDDFARGITANIRDDSDTAIAALSAALKAPDLVSAYVPSAYRVRARAYLATDKCQEALADVDAAAAIRPLDTPGFMLRATIKICLKDIAGAQQDFDAAVGPEPDAILYWSFGRQLWLAGLLEDAHTSLSRSAELLDKKNRTPRASFILLWYALSANRMALPHTTKLSTQLGTIPLFTEWPMPILKLYLGKLAPEKVWDKLDRSSSADYAGQKCEADFYVGEWYLAHNDLEAGKKAIASAAVECPKQYIEYPAAVAEAKRLGLAIGKETSP